LIEVLHLSPYLATVLFAIGAGALALWFDVRFPGLSPERLPTMIGHAFVSMVALDAAAMALRAVSGGPHVRTVAVLMSVMLPALMYTFVVCVWVMKHFSGALHGSPR
jgi:hypothetical protein